MLHFGQCKTRVGSVCLIEPQQDYIVYRYGFTVHEHEPSQAWRAGYRPVAKGGLGGF